MHGYKWPINCTRTQELVASHDAAEARRDRLRAKVELAGSEANAGALDGDATSQPLFCYVFCYCAAIA